MLIQLKDKTPDVYTNESRDFQLLCRAYDAILNGVKFDIDTMPMLLDSMACRNHMLKPLASKLGFFTDTYFNDTMLRYTLSAFPHMVRLKGTLKAVTQAVLLFLKIYHIRSAALISLVDNVPTVMHEYAVPDHTLVVALKTSVKDISVLKEIFKYILPAGYGVYFYFFNELGSPQTVQVSSKANVIFVSDSINSQVRSSYPDYFCADENYDPPDTKEGIATKERMIGAVHTVETFAPVETFDKSFVKIIQSDTIRRIEVDQIEFLNSIKAFGDHLHKPGEGYTPPTPAFSRQDGYTSGLFEFEYFSSTGGQGMWRSNRFDEPVTMEEFKNMGITIDGEEDIRTGDVIRFLFDASVEEYLN